MRQLMSLWWPGSCHSVGKEGLTWGYPSFRGVSIFWYRFSLGFKQIVVSTLPPKYSVSAVVFQLHWTEIEILKVLSSLPLTPLQPSARHQFLCLDAHCERELIAPNCSCCWHMARTWLFLKVLFGNVNCHLRKILNIAGLESGSHMQGYFWREWDLTIWLWD